MGTGRPQIGLPRGAAEWPEARIRAVLHHELAHVCRHDWVVQLVAQFVCAVQWFNPLCWIAGRRLRQLSEMACDDAALRCGMAADEYAAHLLEITRSCRPLSAPLAVVPMARESTFERRIVAMLNRSTDRRPVTRGDLAAMTVLLLVLTAPASILHARQAGPLPFTGSIYDASGALLPEVSVSLTDSQQHEQKTATDASGHFAIPSVPAGKYVLRVMRAGFAPLMQDVELASAGDWARVVTLQVGEIQESVKVETERTSAKRVPEPAGAPLKVGGNIRPPRKLTHVNPVYPQSMKDAGIEGAVPLEAVIAGDGSVQTVRVLTAEVHPDLAIAAVDAVQAMEIRADAAERQARPHQDEGDDRLPVEGLTWSGDRPQPSAFFGDCPHFRAIIARMRELRIGIVGLGWVAGAHIETFKHVTGARVTAVCSRRTHDPAALDATVRRAAQGRTPTTTRCSRIRTSTSSTSARRTRCTRSRRSRPRGPAST